MKPFTWRRVHAVRLLGRRYRRCSRLLGMLLAAVAVHPWLASGAFAQSTVAAGDTETGATVGGVENVSGTAIGDTVTVTGVQQVLSGGVTSNTSVQGGEQSVSTGGVASNTSVASSGIQVVAGGGVAQNTSVAAG